MWLEKREGGISREEGGREEMTKSIHLDEVGTAQIPSKVYQTTIFLL
jgi:hypothetical protein